MRRLCGVLVALLMLLAGAMVAAAESETGGEPGSWLKNALGERESGSTRREKRYVAMLTIDGELSAYDAYYDHAGTLDAIDALIDDQENAGLILLLNTPGGGLYEADELLHELKTYKELTGRPVAAYMEQECCSAGVFAAMGADLIFASRMTLTGNVGVYMESSSDAGLLEKLGVEQIYVASGENKVNGYPELTQEQRAILQALVDESFELFLQEIETSRGLTRAQMEPFMDGRLLSAIQAKEMGLIDGVGYYDEAIDTFYETFGWGDAPLQDVTPEWEDGFGGLDNSDLLDWIVNLEKQTGGADAARTARTTRAAGGFKGR